METAEFTVDFTVTVTQHVPWSILNRDLSDTIEYKAANRPIMEFLRA